MIRLAVFDVDGTLAPIGGPVGERAVKLLNTLEEKGVTLALCSGKPVYYLSGLARQLNLRTPMLLGENGSVLQMGNDLPPKLRETLPFSPKALHSLKALQSKLEKALPSLWYQPNEICLTPFPVGKEQVEQVEQILRENPRLLEELTVYRHSDSFDICPRIVSKEQGVKLLCRNLGIPLAQCAAVGDGENDLSMFRVAGLSLGLPTVPEEQVTKRVQSVEEALELLLQKADRLPTPEQ